MNKDPLNKKLQTKIFLLQYFGILLLLVLLMFLTTGKIFWDFFIYFAIGWFLFLGLITGIALFWMKKNPRKVKKINEPKNLRILSWITLFYCISIIIKNIYYFEDLKIFLFWFALGVFGIIWSIYYIRKNKE
jgi:amino acid transporter